MIFTKTYSEPPVCEKEILRYAGCSKADQKTKSLLKECLSEVRNKLTYKVCYCELEVIAKDDICDFNAFKLQSKKLAASLKECKNVILFAATLGVEIDRLISKYGRISPSKALMLQSIGAERIEALCDTFCDDIKNQYNTGVTLRFSPGYADLSLDAQSDIFAFLSPERKIGLTLNGSILMSPSKSVTAFIGLGSTEKPLLNKCSTCNKSDCEFRGV